METIHQYLDLYPISPDSEKLIVGTIHPHETQLFQIPFFYGNKASLWQLLSDAFPEELPKPLTLANILAFLSSRKIAMSDTIVRCRRKKPTALDTDLVPLQLNTDLVAQIRNSNIQEVFFTSSFQRTNAFKLFYVDILGHRTIPEEIKKNREMVVTQEFGRPVKLSILISPSGSSNVGLSRSAGYLSAMEKHSGSHRPVYDYKVAYYKEKFKR